VCYAIYDVETSIALKQEEITMTVGENIRRIRQERHLTQRQLGEMVGASEAYIRAYESGRRNPKPSSLEKIAEALAVNPEVLANSDFDGVKAMHRLFQVFRQYNGELFEYKDKDGNDVLKVYGEKLLDRYDAVAADMRDAFKGVYNYQNGAYNAQANVEANWYEVLVPTNSFQIIGKTNESYATLAGISNSSLYTEWNTIGFYGTAGNMDAYTLTDVKYHHFNVYTEAKDDIILQFASRIADSKVAKVASKGTKENPFIAKAVYSTDGLQTILKYAFEVSNTDFTLADAFDKPYYLFDRAAAQGVTAALRAELNSSLVNNRQSIVVDKADPSFYGLYPSAKMDQQATNVVTYILDGAAQTANTNKMKFDIAKEVGNGKVIEITYHITDVFGMTKDLTFYVQTLN